MIPMSFMKQSADLQPIEDTVFAVVSMAKQDIAEHGADAVVDATIGSLYDEQGKLVAYQNVFDHYNAIAKEVKAAYAASFTGNPGFRTQVRNWVLQDQPVTLNTSVIATPGGTGAVNMTMINVLEPGQTVILPEICWGSYNLMAAQAGLKTAAYAMFDGDHFNLDSFEKVCRRVMSEQGRLLAVINDPCHNPTGYSMSLAEWRQVVRFLNELSEQGPCVILNDIAYIDYSYKGTHSRDYLSTLNELSGNVLAVIAFSCSKTLTSYGLRCGAALILGQNAQRVREAEIVFEKTARATWSNIPNAAMENFTWITTENREAFEAEKQIYVDLLKQRSGTFIQEAAACGLVHYPYKEGFFVTLQMPDNALRDQYHQKLIDNHIYTVKVNKGIRVAVCSLSVAKVKGLAERMKQILDSLQ